MKKPGLLISCAVVVVGVMTSVSPMLGAGSLEGAITTRNGEPVSNALVYVYTAAPREGRGTICPSCYPDCGKRTRTDAEGRFSIGPVNQDLLFRLLVAAPGYRPDFIKDADPMFGDAHLNLRLLKVTNTPLENRVTGKLIDPWGRPVAGGLIDVGGTRYGQYSYSSATSGKVDPMAVSDERGEFFLDCTNEIAAITVTIEPRGLAKRRMWLETGKAHLIRLKEGVTVAGRLLHKGQPVPAATVAMCTQERESSVFMRGFEVATDLEGRFSLPSIPAGTRFHLFTKMSEMQELNVALSPRGVETGSDGTTNDLGNLELQPSHFVRGRVVLADGGTPPQTRVHLGLENAWDYQNISLEDDGSFEFRGVPAEEIDLSVRVPGYRVSAKNPNKDWLNEGRLTGRLTGNLDDFIIHLEQGERFPRDEGPPDSDRQPRSKPLRGAKL